MPTPATVIVLLGIFVAVAPAIGVTDTHRSSAQAVVVPASAEEGLRQITAARPSSRAVRQIVAAQAAVKTSGPDPAPLAYTVQAGDTLWTIAQRYAVTVETLAGANRIALTAILPLGKSLEIPSASAPAPASQTATRTPARPERSAVHVVRSGETLWEIAGRYGARVEDLMAMNDLGDSDWIRPGQRIVVSAGALPRHRQVELRSRTRPGTSEPVMADVSVLRSGGAFIWPARGTLTSRFGWRYRRHHEGIDLASPRGTPIYAARDGVVEFSGWKGGYGRVVFLAHGGGVVTVYGHASKLHVQPGQPVKKGQLIARVGCTGRCTGSHLHFEVRVNGRAVNPLSYLR
ncbi:MAG: LysM peptidoglycan-binding domain-containing protein [Armatimonadetes bacterium]|nr:LysM peptidoglycan-binding domain-containing protein [Armatimonadota bacterium]